MDKQIPGFDDLSRRLPNATPHSHHRNGTKRRMSYIRKNPQVFDGLLTKEKGSVLPTYYVDRRHKSYWKEEPDFPQGIGPGEFITVSRKPNKKITITAPHDLQKHVSKADVFTAEPVSYDWTPSCIFTDPDTGNQCWPSKTNAVCWWDCHSFTWTPFPLPTVMRDITPPFRRIYITSGEPCCDNPNGTGSSKQPRNTWAIADYLRRKKEGLRNPLIWDRQDRGPTMQFECIGNFCGPSCAMAYALDKHMSNSLPLINIVARMFGYLTPRMERDDGYSRVVPAPPRELLKMFTDQDDGLEIDEFRNLCSCGIWVTMRDSIFITKRHVVEGQQQMAAYDSRMAELTRARQLRRMQQQQKQGTEIAKKLVGKPGTTITTSEMLKVPKSARSAPKGKMTFDQLLKKNS